MNRHALLLILGFLIAACSGSDDELDRVGGGSGPGAEVGPCTEGAVRRCSVTVEQDSGVLYCFHGEQECGEDGVWGGCTDGEFSRQLDPTYFEKDGSKRLTLPSGGLPSGGRVASVSGAPVPCINNPCDPACQYWAEDPGDESSTPGGGTPPGPLDDWSTTTTVCGHQLCTMDSAPLDRDCHPCVATVCNTSGLEYCCDGMAANSWDESCVEAVFTLCSATPPPVRADVCEFSILADQTINLGNATGYPGSIGAHTGVNLNSAVTAENLVAATNLNLTNASNFGTVYTTGTVATQSGLQVKDITALGSVTLGNSATVNGNVRTGGAFTTASSGFTVNGSVVANGDCAITNSSTVTGAMHCGGNVTVNSSGLGGNLYATGNLSIQNQNQITGQVHIGGSLTFTATDGRIGGNAYVGTNVTFNNQNNRVGGQLHVGGNVSCNNQTNQGAGAAAYIGGTLTGTCPSWAVTPVTGATVPPRIEPTPPTIPAFPPPPVTLPSVDDLRRDTTAVCAAADTAPDITTGSHSLFPGVYGDINIPNSRTITLRQPGTYVFNSYTSGSDVPMYFGGSGPWDIIVCKKFHLANSADMYVQGTTTRVPGEKVTIYSAEVSSGCGLSPANCCIRSDSGTNLAGILIAPDCDIRIGNGTNSQVITWGNNVYTESGISFQMSKESCDAATLGGFGSCGTGVSLYNVNGTYSVGSQVTYGGKRYVCADASLCTRATTGLSESDYWTTYWPGEGSSFALAWTEHDDCPEPSIPSSVDTSGTCPVTINPSTTLDADVTGCDSADDCQVNRTCTEVETPSPVCGHSKCVSGTALDSSCRSADECVDVVCDTTPSCCASYWDQTLCADVVEDLCGVTCGAISPSVCPHNACSTGAALSSTCSTAVATVCGTGGFAYCCSTTWDAACVNQFTIATTGSAPSAGSAANTSLCDYAVISGGGTAALNAGRVDGDVFAQGNVTGTGTLDGSAFATNSTISHSNVTGTKNGGQAGPLFTKPTWTAVGGTDCATIPNTSTTFTSWGTTPTPGSTYGNVTVGSALSFPAGTYRMRSLTIGNNNTITLPSGTGHVDIYVCGDVSIGQQANINSPSNLPDQLHIWVNTGNITFNAGQWNPIDADGIFTLIGTGNATLNGTTKVNGKVLAMGGAVTFSQWSEVNSDGISRNSCITGHTDPSDAVPNLCPTATSPATSATVTESGTCVSNLDGSGNLSQTSCADTDLTLDAPCDDQVPVCNRGQSDLAAGQAEILFFPRQTVQFGTTTPDTHWADAAVCQVGAVPAGTCVDVTCPSFMEDMTAFIRFKSSAIASECNEFDNWTYYPWDRACGGGGSSMPKVITHTYDAVCPSNAAPRWGFLAWNTELEGAATVTFEARVSEDGVYSGSFTPLGTAALASSTENCNFEDCGAPVGDLLFPNGRYTHPGHLELRITLTSDGTNVATLEDWKLSYTCAVDQ